jgi:cytochrome c556
MHQKLIVAAAALLLAVPAAALDAEQAEKAADTRQAVLKVIGWNITPLGAMARGLIPWDEALLARNAQRIAWTITMIPDAFRADTRRPDGRLPRLSRPLPRPARLTRQQLRPQLH